MSQLIIEDNISINASTSKVWDALVNPEHTPKYMYGCALVSDFEIGSPVLWKGPGEVIYVKGNLLTFENEKQFSYTVFDPNAAYPDIPENHLSVHCTLEEEGGMTNLKVIQEGYERAAEGQKRYDETMNQGGWKAVLEGIKKIAEE